MNETDKMIYDLLLWILPSLLAILAFIGALAVKALMKMSNDINDIKISVSNITTMHEGLTERVERLEDKMFA